MYEHCEDLRELGLSQAQIGSISSIIVTKDKKTNGEFENFSCSETFMVYSICMDIKLHNGMTAGFCPQSIQMLINILSLWWFTGCILRL